MIGRVGSYAPVSRRLKSNAKRQVISMYLKNLAAAGMSALLLFSGAVSAGAAETVPATHDSETYAAAVETLASNGLAAASATSLQAADGLQLAQEAGLLDESGEELSLTELSAQALLRETGGHNEDPFYAELERELLERINALGIGPQGFGGRTTALAVHMLSMPTHIAGLPVAVNINCHVARHRTEVL